MKTSQTPSQGRPHRLRPGSSPHALRTLSHDRRPAPPEHCNRMASGPPCSISGFRLRARLGFSIPSRPLWPARHYPRFWISRSSSERERDFNPPEQYAAQRTIGLIHPVTFVRALQMRATSLVQLRCVRLGPSARRSWRPPRPPVLPTVPTHARTPGIPQIPSHRCQDYLSWILTSLEWIRKLDRHRVLLYEVRPFELRNGTIRGTPQLPHSFFSVYRYRGLPAGATCFARGSVKWP